MRWISEVFTLDGVCQTISLKYSALVGSVRLTAVLSTGAHQVLCMGAATWGSANSDYYPLGGSSGSLGTMGQAIVLNRIWPNATVIHAHYQTPQAVAAVTPSSAKIATH